MSFLVCLSCLAARHCISVLSTLFYTIYTLKKNPNKPNKPVMSKTFDKTDMDQTRGITLFILMTYFTCRRTDSAVIKSKYYYGFFRHVKVKIWFKSLCWNEQKFESMTSYWLSCNLNYDWKLMMLMQSFCVHRFLFFP